jgi:peptidoglycan-N-acetylglucosamine deacetylase
MTALHPFEVFAGHVRRACHAQAVGTWCEISRALQLPQVMTAGSAACDLAHLGMSDVCIHVPSSVRALVKNAVFDRVPHLRRRGPTTARRVAITFDDGPDDQTTQLLDLLDELGIPATFFLCGTTAEAHPAAVRDYLRRGHQVASHGYDHQRFTALSRRELLDQCSRTEQALNGQLSGRPWIRPPHGELGAGSIVTLLAAGYTVALWSLDSCDYDDKDPESIAKRCAASVGPGEVLLFHEGQAWTREAVRRVVMKLHADGYECVTMLDLFAP